MKVELNVFPNGLSRCVLLSFDDGKKTDICVVEALTKYGLTGTFHVNSGYIGKKGYLDLADLNEIGKKHEIAAHTENHRNMANCPVETAVWEALQDRAILEEKLGVLVKGIAFPYGKASDSLSNILSSIGFSYARRNRETLSFSVPTDFLKMNPTCHISNKLMEMGMKLVETDWINKKGECALMLVTGHSIELNHSELGIFNEFCDYISSSKVIWSTSCMEFVNYISAVNRVQFSALMTRAYNPSAIDVWIRVNGIPIKISKGCIVELEKESNKYAE